MYDRGSCWECREGKGGRRDEGEDVRRVGDQDYEERDAEKHRIRMLGLRDGRLQ